MANFGLIILCIAAGILCRRFRIFPDGAATVLNRFVIVISLPALTLLHVHPMRLGTEALLPIAGPWLIFAGGVGFYTWLARARGWDRATLGTLILVGGLGNTSFLGFPLIEALYGPRGLETAVLADQGGSFLALSTAGIVTACVFSGTSVTPAALLGRLLRFPPFLALLAALALRPLPMPALASEVLERLAGTLAPLALFSVGLQLSFDRADLRAERAKLASGLGYKMLLGPAVFAAFCLALPGARGETTQIAVLETAMAPMITAGILASEHGLNRRLATQLLGVGIPLSLVTIPLAYLAVRTLFG